MITNTANASYEYELPDGNNYDGSTDSNLVTTIDLTTSFTKVKTSDKTYLNVGDTATQTVTLNNDSGVTIEDITFSDTLTGTAEFVTGSVYINGVNFSSYDVETGFDLDNIESGSTTTITYEIIANDPITSTTIENYATISYSVDDSISGTTEYSETTNTVIIEAVDASISVVKTADRQTVVSGDTIKYTTVITNTGTVDLTDLIFTDSIPSGTTFTTGSVYIDGTNYSSYNPSSGFDLDNLSSGNSTTVIFSVTVD